MKFSLIKNDKSTSKDEFYLFLFIIACIGIGSALIAFAPSFWIIKSAITKAFGVLWVLVGVMFIPGLIYRLSTNETKKK